MPGSKGKFSLSESETTLAVEEAKGVSMEMDGNIEKLSFPDAEGANPADSEYPPPFAGMGTDMVLHYADTPAWNRARKILLFLFWGAWFILLGAVIYLTVTHPRCKEAPAREWWQKASVYQVYPRSFKDSDGDGVGDIKGITEKLGYLKDNNVDAVWVSPFYKSPMRDFGYDVSDYRAIDPVFGTMEDFDELLEKMHEKELKLIIDFIPNHTSDLHDWFVKSVNREYPYTNYYIWENCGEENNITLPNNWISVVGGSAWTYHPIRKQCYFHQYQVSMPDLNIRNNRVKDELDDVLRFWLDKGVDGIRVDAILRLYEDYNLEDEVMPESIPQDKIEYNDVNHTKTKDLPEIMDMVNRWRGLLDGYTEDTTPRMMITEAYGDPLTLKMYYGRTKNGGANIPFNFQLVQVDEECDGFCISKLVSDWMVTKPEGATANWVVGNHDRPRISTRVGVHKLDAVNMLLTLLPGVSTTYYGDEIGMVDIDISDRESQDPVGRTDKTKSRDPERSPMQWTTDVSECSGFTSNCTYSWLPVHPGANQTNVEVESKDTRSHLSVYRNLTRLRTKDSFVYGDWKQHIVTENVYSFIRYFDGVNSHLVCVNIGDADVDIDLSVDIPDGVTSGAVAAITGNVTEYSLEEKVDLTSVSLKPGDGIVFTWPYVIKQK